MNEGSKDWYSPDAATFGDRLTAAREHSGMTQTQMAKRLGVKRSTMKSWENDLAEPRANRLSMIAGLLNVSMMWLINGEGEGLDAPQGQTPMSDVETDMMLEMRSLRNTLVQSAERLARLEKALRAQLADRAP